MSVIIEKYIQVYALMCITNVLLGCQSGIESVPAPPLAVEYAAGAVYIQDLRDELTDEEEELVEVKVIQEANKKGYKLMDLRTAGLGQLVWSIAEMIENEGIEVDERLSDIQINTLVVVQILDAAVTDLGVGSFAVRTATGTVTLRIQDMANNNVLWSEQITGSAKVQEKNQRLPGVLDAIDQLIIEMPSIK